MWGSPVEAISCTLYILRAVVSTAAPQEVRTARSWSYLDLAKQNAVAHQTVMVALPSSKAQAALAASLQSIRIAFLLNSLATFDTLFQSNQHILSNNSIKTAVKINSRRTLASTCQEFSMTFFSYVDVANLASETGADKI